MKVLVVDDSPFTLRHHTEIATAAGLEVVAANNGEEAIRLFLQHRPQLVLCDIMMPEMDGYEVLQSLREITTEMVFYFVSAEKTPAIENKARQAGAVGVVEKPLEVGKVKLLVEKLLRYGQAASIDH